MVSQRPGDPLAPSLRARTGESSVCSIPQMSLARSTTVAACFETHDNKDEDKGGVIVVESLRAISRQMKMPTTMRLYNLLGLSVL